MAQTKPGSVRLILDSLGKMIWLYCLTQDKTSSQKYSFLCADEVKTCVGFQRFRRKEVVSLENEHENHMKLALIMNK